LASLKKYQFKMAVAKHIINTVKEKTLL